jgi:hypothetical protein
MKMTSSFAGFAALVFSMSRWPVNGHVRQGEPTKVGVAVSNADGSRGSSRLLRVVEVRARRHRQIPHAASEKFLTSSMDASPQAFFRQS